MTESNSLSRSNKYDPPYTAAQMKEHGYSDDVIARLKNDPIHGWRMKTGIELIHREPSKTELMRIWINWNKMTPEQKDISDTKELELFGVTNKFMYEYLIPQYKVENPDIGSVHYPQKQNIVAESLEELPISLTLNKVSSKEDIKNYLSVLNDENAEPSATTETYTNNLKIDERECYLIYNNDELIGITDVCNADDLYFYIENFVISRKHRGKGYGKLATNEIIKLIKGNHPNKDIVLLVLKTNKKAIHIYEENGFKITKSSGKFFIMKLKPKSNILKENASKIIFRKIDINDKNDLSLACKAVNLAAKASNDESWTIDEVFDHFNSVLKQGQDLLAIELNDKTIGFARVGEYFDKVLETNAATIMDFAIFDEFQGKGYGLLSINSIISYLKRKYPNDPLTIGVAISNKPALNLYKKVGFKVIKKYDLSYLLKYNDIIEESIKKVVKDGIVDNIVYHGSPFKLDKIKGSKVKDYTGEIDSVFVSPMIGIAECFAINHDDIIKMIKDRNGNIKINKLNFQYDIWQKDVSELYKTYNHITIYVENAIFEPFDVKKSGYIYTIDFSKYKNKSHMFNKSKNSDVEFCIDGDVEFKSCKKIDVEVSIIPASVELKTLYHVSDKKVDMLKLLPHIPNNFLTKCGAEDSTTKRISFCRSISECLMAMSQNLKGKTLYVYTVNEDDIDKSFIKTPSEKEVPDSKITNEVWVTTPVNAKFRYEIKVFDAINKSYEYQYKPSGNKNAKTAELYEFNYDIIKMHS